MTIVKNYMLVLQQDANLYERNKQLGCIFGHLSQYHCYQD